jgi:hypothetical protein
LQNGRGVCSSVLDMFYAQARGAES